MGCLEVPRLSYVSKASVIGEGTGCKQPMNFPEVSGGDMPMRTSNESTDPLVGCLGVVVRRTAMASRISRKTTKSGCVWIPGDGDSDSELMPIMIPN